MKQEKILVARISLGKGGSRWQKKKILKNLQERADDPKSEVHKSFVRLLAHGYDLAKTGKIEEDLQSREPASA